MKVTLIILFIGLLTIAPCIYVGVKYFDGKVTAHPYEAGLAYDENKKFINDNQLDLKILSTSKNGSEINISFTLESRPGTDINADSFIVSRPATDKDNIDIQTEQTADGVFKSAFNTDTYGHYILMADTTVNGRKVSLKKSFYIK